MHNAVLDQVWETMAECAGEDLRDVTKYEGTDFETRMRENVSNQYTADEDRDLVTETIIDQLSELDIEAQFKTGNLEALIRVFEPTWVVT